MVVADATEPPPDSAPTGLSSAEAARRLAEVGPNQTADAGRWSMLSEAGAALGNPLVLILLVAGIVSGLLGELLNAAIIVVMVLLSAAVNFAQSYRSQRAVRRLRDSVAPTATVLRDGTWGELPRRLVVPGDLIRLSAGDLVPADARLLEARDLHVQQAALTGESFPAEKEAGRGHPSSGPAGPEAPDKVFLGTSVVSGTGTARVEATGLHTAFGEIAARLISRPPETEFERGLRRFGALIMRTVVFLVLFILVVSLALHRPALESLLFAVALAVGLTPEFLPMITTVTLAQGAVRMARKKVIVKRLPAIQNLGSIDVLCSDKTGTLTLGELVLDRAVDAFGKESDEVLRLAARNSALETGIRSPLDAAILVAAKAQPSAEGKLDEVPFDFERRRLSILVDEPGGPLLITKGSPEGVFQISTSARRGGDPVTLDEAARARSQELYRGLSAEGLRVLAVATRRLSRGEPCGVQSERGMTLEGFLAFVDPPLPDVGRTLTALHHDGVTVKILSGDNELVVRHICSRVGLDAGEVMVGEEVERLGDTALGQVAERTTVFARVSPAQKNRLIQALRRRGHVVGYLGDGINDAPSLHTADVGISVASAVDVARDAADIILLQRSLAVLHQGIVAGRHAFGNVMKYLLMGTSSNFGNMLSMAAASLFLPFLPMLPTQILLNNFLYDLAQVTIPTDHVDRAYVHRPQRWDIRVIRNFMLGIGPISSLYDFLTFWVLLHVFRAGQELFHTGWFIESLATQVLVLFVIRTVGNPLRSRPSAPLAATCIAVVVLGALLPWTPLAGPLGFVRPPGAFFLFVGLATATYLVLVEVLKRRLVGRLVSAV
ncbi:MAG TPA: magnesium-translocating P-type ATPase [Myxococcaceae bacterium]|nr:magnesium-translocating P-type ATPase [Myxococcaceae bacterium]